MQSINDQAYGNMLFKGRDLIKGGIYKSIGGVLLISFGSALVLDGFLHNDMVLVAIGSLMVLVVLAYVFKLASLVSETFDALTRDFYKE